MRLFVVFIIFFSNFRRQNATRLCLRAKLFTQSFLPSSIAVASCSVGLGLTGSKYRSRDVARFFLKLDINPIRRRFQPVSDVFSHGFYTSSLCTIHILHYARVLAHTRAYYFSHCSPGSPSPPVVRARSQLRAKQ